MNNQEKNSPKRNTRDFFMIIIVVLICLGIVLAIVKSGQAPDEWTYNDFVSHEAANDIVKIEATPVGGGGNAKLYVLKGNYKDTDGVSKKFKIIISDEALSNIQTKIDDPNTTVSYTLTYAQLVIGKYNYFFIPHKNIRFKFANKTNFQNEYCSDNPRKVCLNKVSWKAIGQH